MDTGRVSTPSMQSICYTSWLFVEAFEKSTSFSGIQFIYLFIYKFFNSNLLQQ